MSLLRALYSLALLAFPRAFRRRYRAAMLDTFQQGGRDARRAGGRPEAARFAIAAIGDAVFHGLARRLRGRAASPALPRPGRRPHLGATILSTDPLDATMRDLTWALRSLQRRPALSLAVIVTLTLGIGSTTAMFSLMDGILFRPLPYPEPDRLISVLQHSPRAGQSSAPISPANYLDLRESTETFADLGATLFRPFTRAVRLGDEPAIRARTFTVTSNLFDVLQVPPSLGRGFSLDESRPDGPRAVVLSHEFFRSAFGASADSLGKQVTIDGDQHEIVGVMPEGFYFDTPVDIWLPMTYDASIHFAMAADVRHIGMLNLVGRLAAGRTGAQAAEEMSGLFAGLREAFPEDNVSFSPVVIGTKDHQVGGLSGGLWLLAAAVATMLVITGLNIAVLLIASGVSRQTEIATRLALGSSRARLVRQGLVESVFLAAVGAVAGGVLATGIVRGLLGMLPAGLPRQTEIAVDIRVWLFGFVMALVTGVAFGLLPTLLQSRTNLLDALRSRSTTSAGTARLRRGLIVAEVALAFVLLIGAGLLVRSLEMALGVDPGFETSRVLTTGIAVPADLAATAQGRITHFEQIREQLLATPDVTDVGYSSRTPFGGGGVDTTFQIEGKPVETGREPRAEFRRASPELFETLRIPLLAGRTFGPLDRQETERVVVINDAARREYFEDDPVGHRIVWGDGGAPYRIIGVVGDIRYFGLDAPVVPELYISSSQAPNDSAQIFVRTAGDPALLAATLRQQLATANPDVPVPPTRTMDELVRNSLLPRRLPALLVSGFGLFALLLATVGLYGVLAYLVQERSGEIGLRMALGARPATVLRSVVGDGLRVTGIGLLIGVAVAAGTTRFLSAALFGVGPNDPTTFVGVGALLLFVATIASVVPARRATRVDPMQALNGTSVSNRLG